jgi:xanthine/uracil permease
MATVQLLVRQLAALSSKLEWRLHLHGFLRRSFRPLLPVQQSCSSASTSYLQDSRTGLVARMRVNHAQQLVSFNNAPHPLPWGSAEFIGLGFSVFITIIICERFGAPIMKSTAVVIGLLVGCIIAGATGYFDKSTIDAAPAVSFIWVHTFKLSVYGPIVLPLLAVYMVLAMEAIGDITATCDVSRLEVDGDLYDSRIQGGILADGLNGIIAALCTITPMSTFAQNNGVGTLWHPKTCLKG